ncbi:MAG TPA: hypothetical protein VEW67_06900 [Thermoleophilaceae bacterium]|nr:hypothetical protein [Thermoleophilaceae bacterium]
MRRRRRHVARLTTGPSDPATALVGALTDGHRHAAMVIDGSGRLVGLVAQADLLAALARPAEVEAAGAAGRWGP